MPLSNQHIKEEEEEEEDGSDHGSDRKLFEDEKRNPIWFFLHRSIKDEWVRETLTDKITANGGIVRDNESHVDTVLVDEEHLIGTKRIVQVALDVHSDVSKRNAWVEPLSFVNRCIAEGAVRHRLEPTKGMGGSLRKSRSSFTREDDENLARYIALRIPYAENGGRRGNGIYQQLEQASREDPKEYAWVERHTWQSWRNRFNKNLEIFEPMIARYVEILKPTSKQAYGLQRKPKVPQFLDESEEDVDEHPELPSKRRRVDMSLSPEPLEGRSPSPIGKGKEKAVAQKKELDIRHHSLGPVQSEEMEPGPSRSVPKRTFAGRRSRWPGASLPANDLEPQTSQATLVENRNEEATQAHVSDLEIRQPTDSPKVDDTPTISHPIHARQNRSDPRISAGTNPLQDAKAETVTKTVLTATVARPAPVKMARRPRTQLPLSVVATPSAAPYRNTRSRSRSAEPTALPERVKRRRGKAVLPRLAESANEKIGETQSMEADNPSVQVSETLNDERAVEAFLVSSSGLSHTTEGEPPTTAEIVQQQSEDEEGVDSDDAQTDSWLRRLPPVQAQAQVSSSAFDVDPFVMLRLFEEESKHTNVRQTKSRHVVRESRQDMFGGYSVTPQQIQTPQHSRRRRSTSSRDSFPIAGTKASAAKKIQETEEKHTPYMPPAGTKAAHLTRAQVQSGL